MRGLSERAVGRGRGRRRKRGHPRRVAAQKPDLQVGELAESPRDGLHPALDVAAPAPAQRRGRGPRRRGPPRSARAPRGRRARQAPVAIPALGDLSERLSHLVGKGRRRARGRPPSHRFAATSSSRFVPPAIIFATRRPGRKRPVVREAVDQVAHVLKRLGGRADDVGPALEVDLVTPTQLAKNDAPPIQPRFIRSAT